MKGSLRHMRAIKTRIKLRIMPSSIGPGEWMSLDLSPVKILILIRIHGILQNTVNSRYLEFQGALWNTSRYPYLDISDFQIEEKVIRTTTFNKNIYNWTIYRKYCGKEEKLLLRSNFSSFPQYIFTSLLDFHVLAGTRFSLRNKRLF